MPPISPSPRPCSNRSHRDTQESRLHSTTSDTQESRLHSTTIPQPFLQPQPNHASTILRVESMNDFDTTILHSRSYNSDSTTTTTKRGAYPPTTEGMSREIRLRRSRQVARAQSANPEGYPPTEGRCRRQSLEWCRKGPSGRYAGCRFAAPCAGAGRGGWITAWGSRR